MTDDEQRRASTQRMKSDRFRVLEQIAVAWDKRPDLTFAQLVSRGVRQHDADTLALLRLEALDDASIVEGIRAYVLLAEDPTSPGVRQR